MNSTYDKTLRRLYSTRAGRLIWRGFSSVINNRYIKVLVRKALTEPVGTSKIPSDSFLIPKVDLSVSGDGKNLLLVLPFYGPDAASVYVDSICQDFKNRGYRIHVIIYNDSHWRPRSAYWDEVYYLSSQTAGLGQLNRDENGNLIPDGNMIDDWAGDELLQFAASLTQIHKYRFCIVNYVFLSRIFDVMPKSIYKILVTHDIFSNRNSRILDATGGQEGFYFSVEREEEKKGLGRANLVLAIQDEDKKFFSDELGIDNVETFPYIPPKKYLAHQPKYEIVKIGYLASGHRPNIDAILQFISSLRLKSGFELHVGGSICNHIDDLQFPSSIRLIGFVDNLEDFYSDCDIIINPDMLRSGLKIKCVEALSYGKPLVCTEAASLGLNPKSKYHRANSIEECVTLVEDLIQNPGYIRNVAKVSNQMYEHFYEKHHNKERIIEYEASANKLMTNA